MPWDAKQMSEKGARNPAKAAAIANVILRDCVARKEKDCHRIAIATALARTNRSK